MKKLIIIFFLAFVFNVIWENLHSFLYSNYMGGKITEYILIRASLFDALLITLILLPFLFLDRLKNNGNIKNEYRLEFLRKKRNDVESVVEQNPMLF